MIWVSNADWLSPDWHRGFFLFSLNHGGRGLVQLNYEGLQRWRYVLPRQIAMYIAKAAHRGIA